MVRRISLSMTCLFLACAAPVAAGAVELGEPKVSSHIGQQLVADIELTALEDPANAVQVRLASADVYRGAGLDMAPVLGSLRMSVMRREGRQFLHITSLKPVESDRLHLYLDLTDGAQRAVRQATLWFTPDPTPVSHAALPVREPVSETAREPARDPAPAPIPVRRAAPAPVRLAVLAPQARPQACARQEPSDEEQMCAALDGKNAQLREEIVRLEGKVKVLQAALGPTHAEVKPAVAAPVVRTALQRPAAEPEAAPERRRGGMPWAWIGAAGAAVFAAVGAVLALRSRRAKRRGAAEPAEPTLE